MTENQNPSESDSAQKRDDHAAERAAQRGESKSDSKTFEGQGKEVKK